MKVFLGVFLYALMGTHKMAITDLPEIQNKALVVYDYHGAKDNNNMQQAAVPVTVPSANTNKGYPWGKPASAVNNLQHGKGLVEVRANNGDTDDVSKQ